VRFDAALRPAAGTSLPRLVLAAVVLPTVATLVASLLPDESAVVAVSLFLFASVVAAVVGGLVGGIGAAVVSAACFTFFFTEPRNTFYVEHTSDVVAAIALLSVAVVVGLLVGHALDERERAERRERESRLLSYLATKLLSGEAVQAVLDDFVEALLDPLELDRCELKATLGAERIRAVAVRVERPPGPAHVVPIEIGTVRLGTLTAVRGEGAEPFAPADRALIEAASRQVALALERVRLDTQVRDARLEAESNELRAALFSSVTHDLRTPLASIKASATSLLADEAAHDAAQRRELLTTVLEETDRLNRLIGNLMDLARIRAGALTPQREPVAIDEVAGSVITRLRPRLEGVTLRLAIRDDVPEVFADPMQLDQVLTNLVENAAGHSPPGGEIGVSAAPFVDVVQIRVTDQGPGVPVAERERVFEPFYRAGADPERPGSGLGLAIVRAIVVAHGGRIWIEGAPGGGAAVVLELPAVEPTRSGGDVGAPGVATRGIATRRPEPAG
jgi:two-component system sensor histidine kinase KdpD